MDTTAQLSLQAYGNLSSAAKQQNTFLFNFDQPGIKNIESTMGPSTAGKHMLPPLSVTGNDKFEWGNQFNGGALVSPNIYQHKTGFAYTPIITGAQYSSLAKGQNIFNFANASINDDQQTIQQMANVNNTGASGNTFGATPQAIPQLYGDNLNQLYGNQGFNNNNIQSSVAANSMIQSQQKNFAQQNSGINTIGGVKHHEDTSTPFPIENSFQFGNFNGQTVNNQTNNAKNSSSAMISVNNNNNKHLQNVLNNQNQTMDYLNSHQMKIGQNNAVPANQFIPQQQQFPQQQAQQNQQNQQIQQQQIPQQQQNQQQYQNFQKNQFLNGQFTNFSNNQTDQQFQGDANQIANTTVNTAQNPQQQLSAVTGNISQEKKKPQISLSLQIPQGNSVNSNNNVNPQNSSTNPSNTAQNTNGPLTADGHGLTNYFQQYQNNIGLAPFTPQGPTTMGLQSLNGAPPSSHLPPFTQRTGNQQYDNFFFNAPTKIQSIPDQYALLTPGNTGYNKQSFFYPTADQATTAQSQFQQMQYEQSKYQHPLPPQYQQQTQSNPNNPQNIQQNPHMFQQQQQQQQLQQQNPYQYNQSQNPSQLQQNQQIISQQVNFGADQQKMQANQENNDQNVQANKDNTLRGPSGDQKKDLLNFGSGLLDQNGKIGQNGQQDDDKDKNIMQMLQKNNPQSNITQSNYMDAANMSLIIDFYQKANPEKKQQLFDFLSNQQSDDKDDNQKNKSQKIIEYIITANTKRIGTLTLLQRQEKIQKYREKRQKRSSTSLVKYKKQQVAVSKKPRDKNGKFLKQTVEEKKEKEKKKIKK